MKSMSILVVTDLAQKLTLPAITKVAVLKFRAVTQLLVKFLAFTSSTYSLSKDSLALKFSMKQLEELSVSFLGAPHQWMSCLRSVFTKPEGLLNIHALIKQFYR